ncbi:hypothetical protein [Tuanshanicoccus yangjingiae]|uniref:hypothetical protein n=1 Tax=Aerococcaceae bacterium zg-252 TaxID=2796928 RepID=UPI004062FC6B
MWQYLCTRIAIWFGFVTGIVALIQMLSYFIKKAEMNLLILLLGLINVQFLLRNSIWNPFNYLLFTEQALLSVDCIRIIGMAVLFFAIWLLINLSSINFKIQQSLRRKNGSDFQTKSIPMMKILPKSYRFELTKRYRTPYTRQCLLLSVLLVLGSYSYITYRSLNVESDFKQYLEERVSYFTNKAKELQPQVNITLKQSHSMYKEEFEARKDKSLSFEEWFRLEEPEIYDTILGLSSQYNVEANDYQKVLNQVNQGMFKSSELIQFREHYYEKEAALAKETQSSPDISWLAGKEQTRIIKDKELTPLLLGTLLLDQYNNHYLINPAYHIQWSHSTLHSIYLLSEKHLYLLLMLLLIVTLFSSISEERYPNNNLEFLFSLPKSRTSIYWNKYMYNLLSVVGTFCVGLLIYGLFSTIIGSFGQINYPIETFLPKAIGIEKGIFAQSDNLYFTMTPIVKVVSSVMILCILSLSFICSLALTLSIWIKHRFLLNTTLLLLCGLGYYGCLYWIDSPIVIYFPFLYLNAFSISDGWLSHLANDATLNMFSGVITLIGWNALLTVIGWISFKIKWDREV